MKNLFRYNVERLSFEKPTTKNYIKVGGYVICIAFSLFLLGWLSGTNKYLINKIVCKSEVVDTLLIHGEPFSEKALINLLKDCNIKYPHIVLAQAKIESGNYTSNIFKKNHNLFGMRKAHHRITSAQSEQNTYAYYRDWVDCVYDYAMYQSEVMCNITSEEQYFNKLGAKYAQDSSYVHTLKNAISSGNLKSIFEE